MAKITAWLVTLIGVLLVLDAVDVLSTTSVWGTWVLAISVLLIGVTKLQRNYKGKK